MLMRVTPLPQRALHPTNHVRQKTHPRHQQPATVGEEERGGRDPTSSRTSMRAASNCRPPPTVWHVSQPRSSTSHPWRRKHKIAFNPVEPYRHVMQGYIENLVKQMKVNSRCILKHANLPPRIWSETNTLYMAVVLNIMPRDKMKVPFKSAPSLRFRCTLTPS
jgi:hypothetical protein